MQENTTDIALIGSIEFAYRLLVAIGIGFAIGLEREHVKRRKKEHQFAGIRTFVFVVVFGFVCAYAGALIGAQLALFGLVTISAFIGISYWFSARHGENGLTTEVASLVSYVIGVLVALGYTEQALLLTVIVIFFLSIKQELHLIVGRFTQDELYAMFLFMVLAILIFPQLPNETYGPYEVFNPRELGWIVILTSGLGLIGYLMMKFLGSSKGILLTGIVGGLVSSTVVTYVFARKSKEAPSISRQCAVAILAATSIMIVRVLIWTYIFNKALFTQLLTPIALVFFTAIGFTFYYYYQMRLTSKKQVDAEIPLGEPLNLKEALAFGVIYSLILFVVAYASDKFGDSGTLISSMIAGLTDIDAITISLSKLADITLTSDIALLGILIATLSNNIVKMGICFSLGSAALRRYAALAYFGIIVVGIALGVIYF